LYRRALEAHLGRQRPSGPLSGGWAGATAEVLLQELEPGVHTGVGEEADHLPAMVRVARRRRVLSRVAALVLAPVLEAVLLLAWLDPAPPGSPDVTLRGLLVVGLMAAVVPALLALRGLVSYAQLSTMGSWWLLAVPVGVGLGADAWVTVGVLGSVRPWVAFAAFVVVAAICYAVLLLLLLALRIARTVAGLSADGFSFLVSGGVGSFASAVVFAGGVTARAMVLFAAPLCVYLLAVLLPGALSSPRPNGRTLLFLRTFDGPNSLLPGLSRYWLHAGVVHLLAGPDVAARTASAEGVLSFATGRLSKYFVIAPDDVARRLERPHNQPARDGMYDVLEFPCSGDAWRPTLVRLAAASAVILLDLRGFDAANAGCAFELETLASLGLLARTIAVVDATTDRGAIHAALSQGLRLASEPHRPALLRIRSTAPGRALDLWALFATLLAQSTAPPGSVAATEVRKRSIPAGKRSAEQTR
jgi:hypothetical protein